MCAEMTNVDVHIDMTIYHIAENFQGRKLAVWWLYAKPQNFGCGVLWHCKSEQSAKVFSVKVFSLESFPLYGT